MMNISELEQYFPENKPLKIKDYTFSLGLKQDISQDTFVLNLKIQQKDTKKNHLIKFRFSLGKDKKTDSQTHKTDKLHFEIDLYKREKESFSAILYFTFASEDKILEYAKGTVFVIAKIIKNFFVNYNLDKKYIEKLIYEEAVLKELKEYEKELLDALYDCYKKHQLVVRDKNQELIIKTPHNFKKYLDNLDLRPLYLPLMKKINDD